VLVVMVVLVHTLQFLDHQLHMQVVEVVEQTLLHLETV